MYRTKATARASPPDSQSTKRKVIKKRPRETFKLIEDKFSDESWTISITSTGGVTALSHSLSDHIINSIDMTLLAHIHEMKRRSTER